MSRHPRPRGRSELQACTPAGRTPVDHRWLESVDPQRFARRILQRAGITPLLVVLLAALSTLAPTPPATASDRPAPGVTVLARARAVILSDSAHVGVSARAAPGAIRPAARPILRPCEARPGTAPVPASSPATGPTCRLIIIDMP